MRRKPLDYFLSLRYPFRVQVDERDGYFVTFPDLPGCMTGADKIEELPAMIEEARSLWIESEYEYGDDPPEPTLLGDDAHSGKFNLRLPKPLHRDLAESAERAGVSLNQHVVALLSAGDALARVEERLDLIERTLAHSPERSTYVAEERGTYAATPQRASVRKRKSAT